MRIFRWDDYAASNLHGISDVQPHSHTFYICAIHYCSCYCEKRHIEVRSAGTPRLRFSTWNIKKLNYPKRDNTTLPSYLRTDMRNYLMGRIVSKAIISFRIQMHEISSDRCYIINNYSMYQMKNISHFNWTINLSKSQNVSLHSKLEQQMRHFWHWEK